MKNKILAALLMLTMTMQLFVGCGAKTDVSDENAASAGVGASDQADETSASQEKESPQRGTVMSLDDSGELSITRIAKSSATASVPQDGIWTVFVYISGSNLESEFGCATNDMVEMQNATEKCSNLRFVVEAGGAQKWQNKLCSDGKNTRLIIKNGSCEVISTGNANMGDRDTLVDFLDWGFENYNSQYTVLDLWDHGGGSASGVCYDECYKDDFLSLKEIDIALATVYEKHGIIFDLIGCDACLMATAELANICVPYAKYMIASQETEPGTGWDYSAFAEAANRGVSNGGELGKLICDVYYSGFDNRTKKSVTLSVIDLSAMDRFLKGFNSYCIDIYDYICNKNGLDNVIRGAKSSLAFGNGKTNMIDIQCMLDATAAYSPKASRAKSLLSECVVYMKNGSCNTNAGGLSIYYPLIAKGSRDLISLKDICITPYYLGIVDVCVYGSDAMGSIEGYDPNQWIDDDSGYWSDSETNTSDYDYWENESDDSLNTNAASTAITFEVAPHVEMRKEWFFKYKTYTFTLTQQGYNNLYRAYSDYLLVFHDDNNNSDLYLDLGTSFDKATDYDNERMFLSNFSTTWLGLPNESLLSISPIGEGYNDEVGNYQIMSSPIYLNDKPTNLKFMRYWDGNYFQFYVLGTNADLGENGSSARTEQLKKGDVIIPRYPAYKTDTLEYVGDYYGNGYTCTEDGGFLLKWNTFMPDGDYKYSFRLQDIYGNLLFTPPVTYRLDRNSDSWENSYILEPAE